ncbi:hypothetical protein Pelo_7830 [Pelomyxa schiedti]|nr:hypothetical protein Pelo_7830 [Pelomyxa schiedti]
MITTMFLLRTVPVRGMLTITIHYYRHDLLHWQRIFNLLLRGTETSIVESGETCRNAGKQPQTSGSHTAMHGHANPTAKINTASWHHGWPSPQGTRTGKPGICTEIRISDSTTRTNLTAQRPALLESLIAIQEVKAHILRGETAVILQQEQNKTEAAQYYKSHQHPLEWYQGAEERGCDERSAYQRV